MELDPHDVARVAIGGVDPGVLSGLHLAQRAGVQVGVASKARQAFGERAAQAPEGASHGHERLQHPVIPAKIGVIVERYGLTGYRPYLPVGTGCAELLVEWQEPPVGLGDDVPDACLVEFRGKAPLVLAAPGIGQ